MGMTEERKTTLLAYCKLSELAEDPEVAGLLPLFYEAAVDYLAGAGVSEPEEGTPRRSRFDLCVNYLVLDAWDRRDSSFSGGTVSPNPAFRRLLTQLKLTEPEPSMASGSVRKEGDAE